MHWLSPSASAVLSGSLYADRSPPIDSTLAPTRGFRDRWHGNREHRTSPRDAMASSLRRNVNSREYAKAWFVPTARSAALLRSCRPRGAERLFGLLQAVCDGAALHPLLPFDCVPRRGELRHARLRVFWNARIPCLTNDERERRILANGKFCSNGGLGTSNSSGGPPVETLYTWLSASGFSRPTWSRSTS